MDIAWLSSTFQLLDSKKITDRRQGFGKLAEAVNVNCKYHLVINFLNCNNHHTYTWDYVFKTLHRLFISEAYEAQKKNVSKVERYNIQVLNDVLREANADELRITIHELLTSILQILESDVFYSYYGECYLRILITNVLKDIRYCREIKNSDWQKLFTCVKRLCEKSLTNFTSNLLLDALSLIVEIGPKCGLSSIIFRDEFPLITNICLTLKANQSRVLIESILNLNLKFTVLLANDCRVLCCQLGENTAEKLIKLSKTSIVDENIRSVIYKIFLLQMKMHHPRGASEGEVAFYANSLSKWSLSIKCLYYNICYEIQTKMLRRLAVFGSRPSASNAQCLCASTTKLATEVFKQVFPIKGSDFTQMNLTGFEEDDDNDESTAERPKKVQRVEIGIPFLLTNVQRKYGWPWVNVLKEYLEKYPIISVDDFKTVLKVLSKLQLECEDLDLRFHLYRAMTVVVNVETQLDLTEDDLYEIKDIWLRVWDSSVRACGLNQNEEETHNLLQALLKLNRNINVPALFRTYLSVPSVINLSEYSLCTLNRACSLYTLPETISSSNTSDRIKLIQWILGTNFDKSVNCDIFSLPITAHVLVSLQLKTWPEFEYNDEPFAVDAEAENEDFSAVEELYMDTIYESGLMMPVSADTPKKTHRTHIINAELHENMLHSIALSVESLNYEPGNNGNINSALNYLVLVGNTLSKLIEFRIVASPEMFSELKLCQLLKKLLIGAANLLQDYVEKVNKDAIKYLKLLEIFFSTELPSEYWDLVQEWIPLELLKSVFFLLNLESRPEKENKDTKQKEKHYYYHVKMSAMRTLSKFCCVPITSDFSITQLRALKALSEVEFDSKDEFFCESELIFLSTLERLKVGSLSEQLLCNMIRLLMNLCETYYNNYKVVCLVLKVLYLFFPHVKASDSDSAKTDIMGVLFVFVQLYQSSASTFGPDAIACILNCIGQLAKLDPKLEWATFPGGDSAVFQLTSFLKNDHQKVRLCAVSNIVNAFIYGSLQMQRKVFESNCMQIIHMFIVKGHENLSKERQIDEVITRTASALHSYSSIMCANSVWRQRALFAMIQFVAEKKLNIDSTKKMLDKVGTYLKFGDGITFLNTNVYYVISRWHMTQYPLETFPFTIFGCHSDLEFYSKNFKIVVPIIFRENKMELLDRVCANMGIPIKEVIESVYPKIVATYLPSLSSSSSSSECSLVDAAKNAGDRDNNERDADDVDDSTSLSPQERRRNLEMYKKFQSILSSERVQELMIPHIDEVILYLLQLVCDCKHFESKFGIAYMLPESDQPVLNYKDVVQTLKNIETQIPGHQNLLDYLFKENVQKLQNIFMLLTSSIHTTVIVDEKVKYLHHYTIFIDYIADKLKRCNSMRQYIIKHVVMSLLHLVAKDAPPENFSALNVIACRYLKEFLLNMHAHCSDVLKPLLNVVVNTLVPIAKGTTTQLSAECISLLSSVIVAGVERMSDAIKSLDPFPSDEKFSAVQRVYERVRYAGAAEDVSLEDEIAHFLSAGKLMGNEQSRTVGLKFLCNRLSTKKDELMKMYGALKDMRGFSEDCARSKLHQLICMLVKLSTSADENVRIEAARCLGELGPTDLTTLILQTETSDYSGYVGAELLLGKSISLLSDYLVDADIAVMTAASEALYTLLSDKDGRQVLSNSKDYDHKPIDKSFLYAFHAKKTANKSNFNINRNNFQEMLKEELWLPQDCDHASWIVRLACTALDCFVDKSALRSLIPVCKTKVEFAENVLPLVLLLLLNIRVNAISPAILDRMNSFFEKHWYLCNSDLDSDLLSSFSSLTITNSREIVLNKSSIQIMLRVVHLMRMHSITLESAALNYLHVAHAAQFCAAHFTAVMYAELWCQERLPHIMNQKQDDFVYLLENYTSKLNYICKQDKAKFVRSLQAILREGYSRIGDEDAILGCGYSYLMEPNMRTEYGKHIYRNFFYSNSKLNPYRNQIFTGRNVSGERASDDDNDDQLNATLRQSSLYFQSFCDGNAAPLDLETMKRLSEWNFSPHYLDKNLKLEAYERNNLLALKAIHDNDDRGFEESIFQARENVLKDLGRVGLETANGLYKDLVRLQSLVEVEEFRAAKKCGANAAFEHLLDKWNSKKSCIPSNDFKYVEPIIAQRIVLLEDCVVGGHENLKESLLQMQLDLARLARLEGHADTAKRIVVNLLQAEGSMSAKLRGHVAFEEAQLIWKDNNAFAREILQALMLDLGRRNDDPSLNFDVLMFYGKWMYERRSINTQVILKKYFNVAMKIWEDSGELKTEQFNEQIFDAHHVLGNYMDSEYCLVTDHIKSSYFQKKITNMEKSIGIAAQLKRELKGRENDPALKDKRRALMVHENQSNIDKDEVEQKHKERNQYLLYALNYYLKNLQNSDKNNLNMFRVFSLWLENKVNTEVLEVMDAKLKDLPSFKMIPVLPQVIPHIGSEEKQFASEINKLLEKCAVEHPHHTLPLILALKYSYKDREYDSTIKDKKSVPKEPRVHAAIQLVQQLLRKKTTLAPLMRDLELLWDALVELAYYDSASNSVPAKLKISKVRDFAGVAMPTLDIPIRRTGNYRDGVVGVAAFARHYTIPNGINRPKKITCTGTDGVARPQLVKGNDDLHQDAVMQQVFSIMNMFLSKNKNTKRLNLRTYKVVPLSQRCGILEWCENTAVISDYLIGSSGGSSQGAHQKYHPTDASPVTCRREINNASTKPKAEKLKCYLKICKNFKPVFHKYFIERFPQPTVWYERRRAYTNSVATSSMVGYILGLGDRHLTNILIDNSTAEVIHIDFGIAFEQGLLLRTPEKVPFRLTRDIEDGMGVFGVEGNFSRACERTMGVMRENALTIQTILEVLLYDPLYAWTITPAQAYCKQMNRDDLDDIEMNLPNSDGSSEKNSTAERALARLRQKLHGSEGEKDHVSVEAQVEWLIQNARDPWNLCEMFYGWQAYL